jgi:hypothetical protein
LILQLGKFDFSHLVIFCIQKVTYIFWRCSYFSEPTKTTRRFLEDGTKIRVSKKTGHIIPKPDPLADRKPRTIGMQKESSPKVDNIEICQYFQLYICIVQSTFIFYFTVKFFYELFCFQWCTVIFYMCFFVVHSVVGAKDTKVDDVFKVTFGDYAKYLPFIYASEKAKQV